MMKLLIPTFLPSYHSEVFNNADLSPAKISGVIVLWKEIYWGVCS